MIFLPNFLREKIINKLIDYNKQAYELRKKNIKKLVCYGGNYKSTLECAFENKDIAILNFKIELLEKLIK